MSSSEKANWIFSNQFNYSKQFQADSIMPNEYYLGQKIMNFKVMLKSCHLWTPLTTFPSHHVFFCSHNCLVIHFLHLKDWRNCNCLHKHYVLQDTWWVFLVVRFRSSLTMFYVFLIYRRTPQEQKYVFLLVLFWCNTKKM